MSQQYEQTLSGLRDELRLSRSRLEQAGRPTYLVTVTESSQLHYITPSKDHVLTQRRMLDHSVVRLRAAGTCMTKVSLV